MKKAITAVLVLISLQSAGQSKKELIMKINQLDNQLLWVIRYKMSDTAIIYGKIRKLEKRVDSLVGRLNNIEYPFGQKEYKYTEPNYPVPNIKIPIKPYTFLPYFPNKNDGIPDNGSIEIFRDSIITKGKQGEGFKNGKYPLIVKYQVGLIK